MQHCYKECNNEFHSTLSVHQVVRCSVSPGHVVWIIICKYTIMFCHNALLLVHANWKQREGLPVLRTAHTRRDVYIIYSLVAITQGCRTVWRWRIDSQTTKKRVCVDTIRKRGWLELGNTIKICCKPVPQRPISLRHKSKWVSVSKKCIFQECNKLQNWIGKQNWKLRRRTSGMTFVFMTMLIEPLETKKSTL